MNPIIWIFLGINLLSFSICGIDKFLAVHKKWRIPEMSLFLLSIFGGCFGFWIGMYLFHHKTKKKRFAILIPIICLIWGILLFLHYVYFPFIGSSKVYDAIDFQIEVIKSKTDYNQNGVDDYTDILLGARKEAIAHPIYKSAYYAGGYPPETEGVCTDTIWRAFQNAGYSLKDLVDQDIKENINAYPRVEGKPDPNIDFRRVKNLKVFFDRNSKKLTNDISKIEEWMPGDIVIFGKDYSHIAIVSDKRNQKGIPWIIHNAGQEQREEDALYYWNLIKGVTGHYRFPVE